MTVAGTEYVRGDWVDSLTNKYAVRKDRPRQNTLFLVFLAIAGAACIITFAILSVMTLNGRDNCKCSVPTSCSFNGCIEPTQEKCMTDMQYAQCYNSAGDKWQLYAGLAGMGGGVVLLSLIGLRYV